MSVQSLDADSSYGPSIRVVGARTHNLKNISVEIPAHKMTVITGVSGSGKSSLLFDTIFAEGRRRFLSSVAIQSREHLMGLDRPDVDLIDGLPPVLCVEQRMSAARKRSTVATISEVYDYLRLLFSRIGQLHCPQCGQPVCAQSRADIVALAMQSLDQRKVIVLAPLVRAQVGTHKDVFSRIVKDGFVRARVDKEVVDAASPPELVKSKPHDIDVVIDRLIMKPGAQTRLEESVDLALQLGRGQCLLSYESDAGWDDRLFSSELACAACGISFPHIEPRLFSFNSALGACPTCHGLGLVYGPDEQERICESCQGTRLSQIARAVRIDGTSIADFCELSPSAASHLLDRWRTGRDTTGNSNTEATGTAVRYLLPEIQSRLRFLTEVGLDYLSLNRSGDTLSAGEVQRVRLAACLGSESTGVCYLLDEPTAGLHVNDTRRLIEALFRLRDSGNTVVIVEHDLEVIRMADHVIDLGPGAGKLGGQILAFGSPEDLIQQPASVTGPYLYRTEGRELRRRRPASAQMESDPQNASSKPMVQLTGATLHNLKNVSVEFPLNQITCVTGPSGSGKTSLIMQTLVPAIRAALGERIPIIGPYNGLKGTESLTRLIRVDQSPLGRSSRSSPATYSGMWDEVRKVFAKTKESRLRGYTARNFSLNIPESQCPRCRGRGSLSVDVKRFADWQVPCPECDGKRFNSIILAIRYRGRSVSDILEMSLQDAEAFFENFPKLAMPLKVFNELGLGYLKLGQPASTLSGGESQRIKLGTELAKSTGLSGSTLFVLDEPTSGLHPADVEQLIRVLWRLIDQGHSILIVEHNPELISAADWRIDIGPGAGKDGGEVVYSGRNHSVSF